jgi:hypothetical protein
MDIENVPANPILPCPPASGGSANPTPPPDTVDTAPAEDEPDDRECIVWLASGCRPVRRVGGA